MTRRVIIENKSDKYHDEIDAVIDALEEAYEQQVHQLAHAWGEYVFHLSDRVKLDGWRLTFFDNSDQQNALAYHYLGADGKPYSSVFAATILDNGGYMLDGPFSVATAGSHELAEMLGDPPALNWVFDGDSTFYADERCDATENDAYLADNGVALSNFLFKDYFNPLAPLAGIDRFDWMGLIKKPYEIRPGGYAIAYDTRTGEYIDLMEGPDEFTQYRNEHKESVHSRTDDRRKAFI